MFSLLVSIQSISLLLLLLLQLLSVLAVYIRIANSSEAAASNSGRVLTHRWDAKESFRKDHAIWT